jgi:hypothetical protein
MKKIHVLPTENPSRLVKLKIFGGYRYNLSKGLLIIQDEEQYVNIYITSDEEIKEGEWCTDGIYLIQATPKLVDAQGLFDRRDWRKIILTTDQDLIKDGVQAIDDEFFEWFVKNPSCEYVEIVLNDISFIVTDNIYKIIIPKEERIDILEMGQITAKEEPKQEHNKYLSCCRSEEECHCKKELKKETLEEAAERFIKKQNFTSLKIDDVIFEAILFGAKWQQEQDKNKLSEEDMKLAFETGRNFQLTGENNFNELIE